jgi:hypothetical protein
LREKKWKENLRCDREISLLVSDGLRHGVWEKKRIERKSKEEKNLIPESLEDGGILSAWRPRGLAGLLLVENECKGCKFSQQLPPLYLFF